MLNRHSLVRHLFIWCSAVFLAAQSSAEGLRAENADIVARLSAPSPMANLQLSNDGQWLAGYFADGNAQKLGVLFVGGDKAGNSRPNLLPYRLMDIHWHAWIGSSRMLFAVRDGGLVLYDAPIGRLRPLIETNSPKPDILPPLLLAALRDDGRRAILQWEDPANPGFPAVYEVDVLKARSEKIVSGFRPIVRWLASADGEVGGGIGFKGQRKIIYGPGGDAGFRPVWAHDVLIDRSFDASIVEAGAVTVTGLAGGQKPADPIGIASLSLLSGEMRHISLKTAGESPVLAVYPDPISGPLGAVALRPDLATPDIANTGILATGSPSTEGLAPTWRALNARQQIPMLRRDLDETWLLVGADHTGLRGLYKSTSRRQHSRYQLVLGDSVVWQSPRASTTGYALQALMLKRRDASKLPVYVAMPKTRPRGALLLIHGGPHDHVRPDFDPLVALAVEYGLAVFQPDFLGSSGYSDRYRRRGMGEWGRAMQSDIDTVAGHIRRTLGRQMPLLVAGGSYGGMSALLAVADQPLWYRGVFTWAAVTDIRGFYDLQSSRRLGGLFAAQMRGRFEPSLLARRAPMAVPAGQIKVPVVMLHAAADPVVPVRHMAEFAQRHPAYVTPIDLAGRLHQITGSDNKKTMLESFLSLLEQVVK